MQFYNTKKRLCYLDILKGIGIILVVVGHIYQNDMFFNWVYSFHMPLFFFAAGLVYREKSIMGDIKRRFQTIVIPYFCFGSLTLLYWQLVERQFRYSDLNFTQSLFGLFSGWYDYLEFNVHLWFLPCFYILVVFYNVLVRIGKNYGREIAVIVSTIMSVIYLIVPLPSLPGGMDRVFRYIGFYAIGSCFALFKGDEKIRDMHISVKWIIAITLIAVNFIFSYIDFNTGIMWYVTAMIGTTAILIISIAINKNRVLEYLGRISLVILCIHGPIYRILVAVVSMLLKISTNAVRENLILTMIITAFTLCLCAITHNTLNRFIPWIIGDRKSLQYR